MQEKAFTFWFILEGFRLQEPPQYPQSNIQAQRNRCPHLIKEMEWMSRYTISQTVSDHQMHGQTNHGQTNTSSGDAKGQNSATSAGINESQITATAANKWIWIVHMEKLITKTEKKRDGNRITCCCLATSSLIFVACILIASIDRGLRFSNSNRI